MAMPCVEHSVYRAGCPDCRIASRSDTQRRRALRRTGMLTPPVPIAQVRSHLERLQRYNMSYTQISLDSGLPLSTVRGMDRPRRRWVAAEIAEALFRVAPRPPTGRAGTVNVMGSARRSWAMAARGFSLRCQAREAQTTPVELWAITRLRRSYVSRNVAQRIAAAYDRREYEDAPTSRAATLVRNLAEQHLWLPPEMWTPDIIDNPYALPFDPLGDIDQRRVQVELRAVIYGGEPQLSTLLPAERIELAGQLHRRGWGNERIGQVFGGTDYHGRRMVHQWQGTLNPTPRETPPMIILVTGDRHANAPAHLQLVHRALVLAVGEQPGPHELVQGGASGIDELSVRAARCLGWVIKDVPADWDGPCREQCHHGGRRQRGSSTFCPWAGNYRNQEMVDYIKARLAADPQLRAACLGFPVRASKGTKDCMRRARAAGIPVIPLALDDPTQHHVQLSLEF